MIEMEWDWLAPALILRNRKAGRYFRLTDLSPENVLDKYIKLGWCK